MKVEFKVLGPLEVRLDGERVSLGGTRPRAVLAALLLERNKVVDIQRLIYAIWADDPPSTDIAQIRMAVSVLRQKLGPAGDRIITRPPGYLIRVERGELDLDVFEAKVEAGLQALRAGEPDIAADFLQAAEDLRRGPALSDLHTLPVHNFVVEVDSRYETAKEARILADLMLGRHLAVLPELLAMPDRTEQLNGCLMVALQRSGRHAEALEVFHQVRRAARELGLDPPRGLSTLYQAILVGNDGALDAWLRGRVQPAAAWQPRVQDDATRQPSSIPLPAPEGPATPEGPAVTLHVTAGTGAGRSYRYTSARTCIVGRGDDCDPQFSRDPLISRRHCRLDIRPPEISIRDLGSSNGTFVNDQPIGRSAPASPSNGQPDPRNVVDLVDGDEIRVGHTVIRVGVEIPIPVAPTGTTATDPCERPGISGYTFVRELSRRSTSVVYLVEHQDTGELAALKVLQPDGVVDQQTRQAFLRETEAGRILRHRNIVTLRDSGIADDDFFLVYDYCEGGSVDRLLARPLPVDEAVAITLQVLDGLAYAHEVPIPEVALADGTSAASRGLVHRDVKPSNILLSGSGPDRTAKLADFGLAKAFGQAARTGHTRVGEVGGTVAYMCRQQVLDYRFAKPAVDVWAAAATLYRMLTGTTPRDFPPGIEPVLAVLQSPAVSIRVRDPSIPARLAAVIDDALIDDPSLAILSATDLKSALIGAL